VGRRVLSITACLMLASAAWFALAAAGALSPTRVKAALSAKQEVPVQVFKAPKASGSFFGTLTKTARGYRLSWQLTFKNLSGTALFAHVQWGRAGKAGPLLIKLCAPCKSGARGNALASPGEVPLIKTGRTYVNVRTAKNRAGEIRGQIKVG